MKTYNYESTTKDELENTTCPVLLSSFTKIVHKLKVMDMRIYGWLEFNSMHFPAPADGRTMISKWG